MSSTIKEDKLNHRNQIRSINGLVGQNLYKVEELETLSITRGPF